METSTEREESGQPNAETNDPIVTVCAECERASCWYGEFMCDESRTANTKQVRRSVLAAKKLESSHYWTDKAIKNGGTVERRHTVGSAAHAFD